MKPAANCKLAFSCNQNYFIFLFAKNKTECSKTDFKSFAFLLSAFSDVDIETPIN